MDRISATASSEVSPEPSAANLGGQQSQKPFSCVLCSQRKVKCDKSPGGCNNCTKARVPCVYKAPPPPRRRRKGVRDIDTATRIRVYEAALRTAGIDPESLLKEDASLNGNNCNVSSGSNGQTLPRRASIVKEKAEEIEAGMLVTEHGKSRYLENGIWTSLRSEFRDSKEILDESSDDESDGAIGATPEAFTPDISRLMFSSPISSTGLRPLHPQPVEAFKLWQAYLDNINPLVKLFHAPTVQQLMGEANGNLNQIPRSVEALLFAIYCIVVESLSDGECLLITGDSKDVARQRFRTGAQHALINASFLKTSDLMILQALTLFIISLQDVDARIVWMLSGVAQRIGQRIGLHRDGDVLKLPPFEAEIRRRLWYQIVMLEGFSQKLAGTGTGSNASVLMGDVKMPANINDSDLFPGMKELPKESERATEMMFFLIRCHVSEFLKRFEVPKATFDGAWSTLTTTSVGVNTKEKAISELEILFEQRYLRYCDPSVTWHLMCSHLAKAIIFMMRFMAYSASYQGKTETQAEKDALFSMSLQVCASQNLAYTMKEMQGFMWHVNMHFQWKAFVYVLSELRYRTSGPEVAQAWEQVQLVYDFHPTFDEELAKRALPIAVSNLALKAWEAYTAASAAPQHSEPLFIQLIRNRQHRSRKSARVAGQLHTVAANSPSTSASNSIRRPIVHENPGPNDLHFFDWNPADLNASLGMPPIIPDLAAVDNSAEMDWSSWNDLIVDFQTNDTMVYPSDILDLGF